MKRSDLISGTFWLIFALIVCFESYRLGLGNLGQPGAGFLLFWAGVSVGILSLIVLLKAWRTERGREPDKKPFFLKGIIKIISVMGLVFLYALGLERIGFLPSTFLLFLILLGVIEKRGWFFSALSSLGISAGVYTIFHLWLGTQLPKGLLGF